MVLSILSHLEGIEREQKCAQSTYANITPFTQGAGEDLGMLWGMGVLE